MRVADSIGGSAEDGAADVLRRATRRGNYGTSRPSVRCRDSRGREASLPAGVKVGVKVGVEVGVEVGIDGASMRRGDVASADGTAG